MVPKPKAGKKNISIKVANEDKGKFKLVVYAYTAWGKKVYLNEETYRLRKKDLGKNGWFYEKYNGKKYKFYYVNNGLDKNPEIGKEQLKQYKQILY